MDGNVLGADTTAPLLDDGGQAVLAWLARMRDQRPVFADKYGIYHVTRYDDVQRVVADPATFSSDQSRVIAGSDDYTKGNLAWSDPPEHRKLRSLVNQAFTRRTTAALAPRVVKVANDLLDTVAGSQEFDLVETLALPLPVIVIAELLGVPASDRDLFRDCADRLVSSQVENPTDQQQDYGAMMKAAIKDITDYLLVHSRQRRAAPRDDLITKLVLAEVDGERLTDDEVANFGVVLLLAGYITSNGLIGNTVLCLDRHPEAAAQIRADRSLVPAAIEEVLRYRPPGTRIVRATTRETELNGVTIPVDSLVILWLLSANHDERRFPHPERFDVRRDPNPQLTFGHGIHFCVGAALARLEGKVALEALLDRFSDMRITPGAKFDFHQQSLLSARHIPLEVTRF